eukprot:TRINITY_DN3070_c0_g1_i1.p1 TRINITY_DN3070_c0_g1~~TRINITY_DN3070_c0_g1_i1.p1  ORF type:complete len:682 (-),score=189.97 TRINITY_DN3070_c0_g1_i1:131-2176(-)
MTLGALGLLGLCRRVSMPYMSAMKFLNSAVKPSYLSAFERRLYVQRPEEKNMLSLLKKSNNSFFAVVGPRKSGKSALLRHLADFPLKNSALYLKIEQKLLQPEELHKTIAKTVGYHSFHEESLLSSIFCFWRMFQENKVDRHSLELYLEKVGQICKRITKGSLPVLVIDGACSLGREGSFVLDDMAYLAKSLADSRSMAIIFGLLEGADPHVLNSRGYNICKQRIYLPYMTHEEVMEYASKGVDNPLREDILRAISEENKKIYGGNLRYINLLMDNLQYIKNRKEIKQITQAVEAILKLELSEELKKAFINSRLETDGKLSMHKVFKELSVAGELSLDKYLSLFKGEEQSAAVSFLSQQMLLREERDVVSFQGQTVKYFVENHLLNHLTNTDNEGKELDEYKAIIEATILKPEQDVRWSDLVGLDSIKQKMQETIVFPTLNPLLFTGLRTPVHGVLFYGPPGNGKTMIAKVLANECRQRTFFNLSSSTFSLPPDKQPEKLVKALFSTARERQPAIIFMDEMDSILSKGCSGVKEEFTAQLEALGSEEQIVIVGATNRPFDIEGGVLKQFPVRLYLELPCAEARKRLLKKMGKSINSELNTQDYDELVKRTNDYSFADLSALFREASYQPIREISREEVAVASEEDIRPVRLEDFEEAFKRVSKSVAKETLIKLNTWSINGL